MFVNVKLRATSRRKAAFFWLDSSRVTSTAGAQIFMGRPGKPAPEPMSISRALAELRSALTAPWTSLKAGSAGCADVVLAGKSWRAAKRDSPKWRVTISSGWRMAVRLMRAFQRSNRSMYVDIFCRSLVVSRWSSAGPRKGWSRSAMRAGSIRLPIVDGDGGFRESASIAKRVGHDRNCRKIKGTFRLSPDLSQSSGNWGTSRLSPGLSSKNSPKTERATNCCILPVRQFGCLGFRDEVDRYRSVLNENNAF